MDDLDKENLSPEDSEQIAKIIDEAFGGIMGTGDPEQETSDAD